MQSKHASMHPLLAAQLPVLKAVTHLFHPFVEAVLHDLQTGTIAAIANNLSQRKVGDQSAITKFVGDKTEDFPDIFEPYYKTNWDGRKFKCVSVTVRDTEGMPVGLLCFNFDTSVLGDLSQAVAELLHLGGNTGQNPIEQFTEDWQQRVNECIGNYLKENQASLRALTKDQKRALVCRLYAHGLFNYRNAAAYVSTKLQVSRATVYNYLKEGEEA